MLHAFAILVKLAVGPDRFLRGLLRLTCRFLERANPFVHFVQPPGLLVERGQSRHDLIERAADYGSPPGDVVERLAERRQFRRATVQRGEHRVQGAALFARGGNQALEIVALLLRVLALAAGEVLQRIEHGSLPLAKLDEIGCEADV